MKTNLATKLFETCEKYPDKIAIQQQTEKDFKKHSYQQLQQEIQKIVQLLQKSKAEPGDKIAIVMENRPEWVFSYFGILSAGAIAVPLDPQSSQKDMGYFLQHSESKIIFTSDQFIEKFNNISSQIINVDNLDSIKGARVNPGTFNRVNPGTLSDTSNLASILYTSGTTGRPKGVMLSHSNFYSNFTSLVKLKLIGDNENTLGILPLHHSFPFMTSLLTPLLTHNTITFPIDLKSDNIVTCLQTTQITIFILVPQILNMLAEKIQHQIPWSIKPIINLGWLIRKSTKLNLNKIILSKLHHKFGKQLRFFVCGGAKLDLKTVKFFTKLGFTILQGYGLTETAPVATFNALKTSKLDSVGKAIPGVKIKISPENEILIKGPNVMLGYYKNPEITKQTIINNWFHTGDLGYLDPARCLYITGRKKEIIVLSSGKNINPENIENYYLHSPYIKELCVIATEKDKLVAVIVPDADYMRKKHFVNFYEIIKWDLENLSKYYPPYKRIMGFSIAKNELPRTHLGKLKRYLIKDLYTKRSPLEPETTPNNQDLELYALPITKQIQTILAKELNILKPIQLDDHLEIDLGVDSLRRIELILVLEKAFTITISEITISRVFTVRNLITELIQLTSISKTWTKKIIKPSNHWQHILKTKPDPKLLKRINLTPRLFTKILIAFATSFSKIIFKLVWRLNVTGQQNLPSKGPFILCSNHASYLDGPAIAVSLPKQLIQNTFTLAYAAIFEQPVFRRFVKLFKIIPVNQAVQLIDAMQISAHVLRHNKALILFPAGARSIDGSVQPFKKGVGILAKELNIPLVPVAINGSFEAWPRGKTFPKPHKITVTFGKPIPPATLQQEGYKLGAKNDYEAITLAIREKITLHQLTNYTTL